jgi:protein involved in polysaccharide export with SLBB domain
MKVLATRHLARQRKEACMKARAIGLMFAVSVSLSFSTALHAQQARQLPGQGSELTKENLGRVGASPNQIQAVLRQQPGLLIELKRWVAQEAASNGQIVKDSDLTDQRIFARLVSDTQFRSVATRLLERYGYLVPKINPESDAGQERKLVLQARANQLAQEQNQQVEAQLPQANRLPVQPYQQTRDCQESDSQETQTGQNYDQNHGDRSRDTQGLNPTPMQNCPPYGPPPQQPSGSQSRSILSTEQTPTRPYSAAGSSPPDRDEDDGLVPPGVLPSPNGQILTASGVFPSQSDTLSDPALAYRMNGTTPQLPLPNYPTPRAGQGNVYSGNDSSSRSADSQLVMGDTTNRNTYGANRTQRDYYAETLNPTLVRTPSPYSDIPSLYDMYQQGYPRDPHLQRFGVAVFRENARSNRNSESLPMDLPVGPDYVLGPGDGVTINLWGSASRRLFRTVDSEGRLTLPEAGPILVSGRSLGQVQEDVQHVLRTQFRDVSADVSLTRLRTVRVYVVGDVQHPGAYDISSLSTPLNALFAAGGPTPVGSSRLARHFRGNKLVEEVDLYDLLLHGVRSDMLRLQSGDTLLVPPLAGEVTIEGMVRRPAIYELNGEKNLAEALQLAGGVLPTATLTHIEVQRLEANEKHTMLSLDIPASSGGAAETEKKLAEFAIQPGDTVHVFPIAPFNKDAVYLEGHVLRPGKFSYHSDMKLTDVIASYADLLPEPATRYAEIIRLNPPDYHPTVEGFDLGAALENPESAPKLQPLDTIRVFARFDFQAVPKVTVLGEVRAPGTYRTSGQVHLRDAIQLAGGLGPDAQMDNAQVFQYVTDSELKITTVNLSSAFTGNPIDNIVLGPRDRIVVHRNLAKADIATVMIAGQVARPGRYPLTTNLRVADLVRLAGGLKRSADPQAVDLTSYSSKGDRTTGQHQTVNVAAALSGEPYADLALREGDVLTVPEIAGWSDRGASIEVLGEVNGPGTYGIKPGDRLSTIVKLAGGFQSDAYPYGAVLERASVRDIEDRSRAELVQRLQNIQSEIKVQDEPDPKKKQAKELAYAQWQTSIDNLTANPPLGRLTIRISSNIEHWANTPSDIEVRDGDVLLIPKKPNQVMVTGQVYNSSAIGYRPNKSAKWYLSQAGGPTQLANKGAAFVIRADGTVISSSSSGLFIGNAMNSVLQPGDMVVVPEKAIGGGPNWQLIMQAAQVAATAAVAIGYFHP